MQDTHFISQLVYSPAPGMTNNATYYVYAQQPSYGMQYPLMQTTGYEGYQYAPHPPHPKPKHKGATLRKKRRPKPSSSLGRQAYYQHTFRSARQVESLARRSRGRTPRGADATAYAQAVQYLKSVGVATGPGPSAAYLDRKPRAWRGGFKSPSAKRTLGSYLSRPFKLGSLLPRSPTFSSRPFQLNPYLAHRPRGVYPALAVDLRWDRDPEGAFPELDAPATSPPVPRMHLWHKTLPWYINIEASPPSGTHAACGVTVRDVLAGIHAELARPIASHEYYNSLLTSVDREALARAFQRRCRGDLGLITKGISRVDFLALSSGASDAQDRVWFAGLEEVRGGMWELKTGPRPAGRDLERGARMIIE